MQINQSNERISELISRFIGFDQLPDYSRRTANLSHLIITSITALILVSLINLIFLFIINIIEHFAGLILNKRHKKKLNKLYEQYSKVISNANYCEDYTINRKHRQRDNPPTSESTYCMSDSEIEQWVDTFISFELNKRKLGKQFQLVLKGLVIILYLGIIPFGISVYTTPTIHLTAKIVSLISLGVLFKLMITEINNFQVAGFRLNQMSYKGITYQSKLKDKYDDKIHNKLGIMD